MNLFDLELFFGFPLDETFKKGMLRANPHAVKLFLESEHPDYLCRIHHEGQEFVGKFVGNDASVTSLRLCLPNIQSIGLKIVPGYDFAHNPPLLFAAAADTKK